MEADRMYQIGDYVVKSVTGVCKVKDIANPGFTDQNGKLYYLLMPLADEGAKVYVPVEGCNTAIRSVMTEKEAKTLISRIPEIEKTSVYNEKERERRYKEAIKSNDPETLVGVLKLIYQRKQARQAQGKKITDADKKYFNVAEQLLYSELEISMGTSKTEICNMIRKNCESA